MAAAALPARSATSRRDSSSLRRASSSAARCFASSSACRRASSSSCLRRASSSALSRASAAARSSSWRRRSASASALRRRASSSALRASCRTRTRVACSSAVSVRAMPAGRAVGRLPGPTARPAARARGLGAATAGGGRLAAAGFRRTGRHDALLANLDRHRLRAAMREALAHLAGLDRAAQPQRAAGTQRQGRFCSCSLASCSFASVMRFGTVLLCRRSFRPQPRLRCRRFIGAGRGNAQPGQLLADRASSRRHSFPPPTAACTIRSRPNAAPSSAAVSTVGARQIPPQRRQLSPAAFRAVPGAQQQGGPPVPYRVADPVEPGNRQAGPAGQARASRHTAGPAELRAGPRDPAAPIPAAAPPARKTRFATARSTISRRGVNHKPRPGSRAVDIGHDRRRRARRQSAAARARSRTSPVAMQRRCGDAAVSPLRLARHVAAACSHVKRRRLYSFAAGRRLGCRPRRTNGRVRGPP